MGRIFEVKGYSDEKAFKLVILKMKGYVSLWYENLKRNRATEAMPNIRTWSRLKKHIEKGSYHPPTSKSFTSISLLLTKITSRLKSILKSLSNSK